MDIPITKYDESVETKSEGKAYFKASHQYNGTIKKAELNEHGFISLTLESNNGASNDYTSVSVFKDADYAQETISKWGFAVITSNTTEGEQRETALKAMRTNGVNPNKWVGYKTGFVCTPQRNKKDASVDMVFASPSYLVPYDESKEGVCLDEGKYSSWVKLRADKKNSAPSVNSPQGADTPFGFEGGAKPPIDDDLPF